MSLGKMTLRSSLWNFAANSGQQFLQFAFFIFLARLLEPKAFGLVAMAMVAVDLLTIVGRMGLLETLIQRKEESEALQNRVFWILQGLGLGLTGLVVGFSGVIADAYSTPELTPVIQGFAVLIWLRYLGVVHEARLRRRFQYKNLAARTLAGTLLGSSVGLVFAFMGMGVFSLVIQRLAMVTMQVGILWASDGWRPKFDWKVAEATDSLRNLLKMGSTLMVGQLVSMANNRMVDVIVGFFMGHVALGYLRVAWRIFDFVLQFAVYPVTNVALSAFSRLQSEPKRLKNAYLKMVELCALITCPAFFGLAGVAGIALPLIFGEQWGHSVPLMQLMSVMALAAIVNIFFSPIMTATGHAKLMLRQGLIQLGMTLALTALAAQWSLVAVVCAHAFRALFIAYLNMRLQSVHAGIGVRDTLKAVWKPLSVALAMGCGVWVVEQEVVTEGFYQWVELGGLMGLGGVIYLGLMALFFRKHLQVLIRDVLQMLKRDGKKPDMKPQVSAE